MISLFQEQHEHTGEIPAEHLEAWAVSEDQRPGSAASKFDGDGCNPSRRWVPRLFSSSVFSIPTPQRDAFIIIIAARSEFVSAAVGPRAHLAPGA